MRVRVRVAPRPVLPTGRPAPAGGPSLGPWGTRTRRTAVAGVAVLLLVLALVAVPVPYVSLGPGPTSNTLGSVGGTPLISVSGTRTYPTRGELLLTTVTVRERLLLPELFGAWWDDDVAVVPRERYFPPGEDPEDFSRRNAAAFARLPGVPPRSRRCPSSATTCRSRSSSPRSWPTGPASGRLRAGDVVVAVDGEEVGSSAAVRDAVRLRAPGEDVVLDLRRDGAPLEVEVPAGAAPDDPGAAFLGVATGEEPAELPFDVDITLDEVGGPSAGLMFALGVVDVLTPEDLVAGRVVAGTGEIGPDGTVGPIGGIGQKLRGASQAGAEVFLVPAENCEEAVADPPDGLRLARVEALPDALAALEALREGREPAPCPGG